MEVMDNLPVPAPNTPAAKSRNEVLRGWIEAAEKQRPKTLARSIAERLRQAFRSREQESKLAADRQRAANEEQRSQEREIEEAIRLEHELGHAAGEAFVCDPANVDHTLRIVAQGEGYVSVLWQPLKAWFDAQNFGVLSTSSFISGFVAGVRAAAEQLR